MIKPLISFGLAAGVLFSSSAMAQGVVDVGANPTYSFRSAPTNSMGIKSLAELKGKPVLIEFWGTR
ncbi:MAG: hypothetical protein ACJA2W_003611 [Planctomycetota bacterium]|jgi:hypothetical protein|tara:strand:- start:283 stop:480 length:198 start_codon:yes stop_codon:yes gene_type:complete